MTDALIQTQFAGYHIESRVGRGGMGVVHRATELALDRSVALKVLTEELAQDAGFRRRFASESKFAASLDHPNVTRSRGRRAVAVMIPLAILVYVAGVAWSYRDG